MKNTNCIILAWELYQRNVLINDIANHCGKHRATVSNWINSIKKDGLKNYLNSYETAKKKNRPSRQISFNTKKKIWEIKRINSKVSGYQIQKLLKKKHNISLSISKVYAIIKEKH
ncbi:MAG: hypothetical protein ABIJ83_00125 [Patescibacteria group bacterium]